MFEMHVFASCWYKCFLLCCRLAHVWVCMWVYKGLEDVGNERTAMRIDCLSPHCEITLYLYHLYTTAKVRGCTSSILSQYCKSDDASGSSTQIVATLYGCTIQNLSIFVPWHKIKTVRLVHTGSLSAPCPSSLWSVCLSAVVSSSYRDISAQHAFSESLITDSVATHKQTHTQDRFTLIPKLPHI